MRKINSQQPIDVEKEQYISTANELNIAAKNENSSRIGELIESIAEGNIHKLLDCRRKSGENILDVAATSLVNTDLGEETQLRYRHLATMILKRDDFDSRYISEHVIKSLAKDISFSTSTEYISAVLNKSEDKQKILMETDGSGYNLPMIAVLNGAIGQLKALLKHEALKDVLMQKSKNESINLLQIAMASTSTVRQEFIASVTNAMIKHKAMGFKDVLRLLFSGYFKYAALGFASLFTKDKQAPSKPKAPDASSLRQKQGMADPRPGQDAGNSQNPGHSLHS